MSAIPSPPPSYAETYKTVSAVIEDKPPCYTFPTSYAVGGNHVSLLVTISEVKGHLALLRAFAELKQKVEGWNTGRSEVPLDSEKRWVWFVDRAVERCVIPLSPKSDMFLLKDHAAS